MVILPHNRSAHGAVAALAHTRVLPNVYDLAAVAIIAALIILVAHGAIGMRASLEALSRAPVSLDVAQLPEYALRTTLRMFAAIFASLLFTFVVAALAAKSRRAELIIIPALDILQSVPVLGFLTFTVSFFMGLFPGSQLGAECASIFAIFTSQAWNMAFSFYQSLKTVPRDLDEATPQFRAFTLAAVLAAGGAVCSARSRLEHDDVDVRRLVLRRRLGSNHGWRHDGAASRDRLLSRSRHRAEGLCRRWLGRSGYGDRHRTLRSALVPARRRMGGQVPFRANGGQAETAVLGVRIDPPHALDQTSDGAARLGLAKPDARSAWATANRNSHRREASAQRDCSTTSGSPWCSP